MQHTAAEHTLYYQLPQLGHVQRFNMSAYGKATLTGRYLSHARP
jgi:hypothetical protein